MAHASESPAPAFPEAFVERLIEIFGEPEARLMLARMADPARFGVRINTLRIGREEMLRRLRDAGFECVALPGFDDGLVLPVSQRAALLERPEVAEGLLYPQGIASQLATHVLDPKPGDAVLDLCAAPGGKTGHIWQRMLGTGRLLAIEAVPKRLHKLRGTLARLGCSGVETRCMDGRVAARRWPEAFDRVMLDAPCSSEARFDPARPETMRYWSLRKIREMRHKQRGLIRAALAALKPGGVLVYATCSFAPEENESVIDDALRRFGERIAVEPVELPAWVRAVPARSEWRGRSFDPAVVRAVRLLPSEMHGGFFLCRIRRLA